MQALLQENFYFLIVNKNYFKQSKITLGEIYLKWTFLF